VELDLDRTSLNGNAGSVSFNKISGSRVRFTSSIGYKSPGFDINDLGFLRRADVRSMSNWLQWRHDKPSKYLRSFRFNLNQWGSWNFAGDRLDFAGNINAHAVFANKWSTGMGLNRGTRGFDDRATRGVGPGAYGTQTWSYWSYLNSDERKRIALAEFFNVGGDASGSRQIGSSPSLTFRPASFLSLSGGFDWSHNIQQTNGWRTPLRAVTSSGASIRRRCR
jgi:hypothetical protein